jgi:hypothetical protein
MWHSAETAFARDCCPSVWFLEATVEKNTILKEF